MPKNDYITGRRISGVPINFMIRVTQHHFSLNEKRPDGSPKVLGRLIRIIPNLNYLAKNIDFINLFNLVEFKPSCKFGDKLTIKAMINVVIPEADLEPPVEARDPEDPFLFRYLYCIRNFIYNNNLNEVYFSPKMIYGFRKSEKDKKFKWVASYNPDKDDTREFQYSFDIIYKGNNKSEINTMNNHLNEIEKRADKILVASIESKKRTSCVFCGESIYNETLTAFLECPKCNNIFQA